MYCSPRSKFSNASNFLSADVKIYRLFIELAMLSYAFVSYLKWIKAWKFRILLFSFYEVDNFSKVSSILVEEVFQKTLQKWMNARYLVVILGTMYGRFGREDTPYPHHGFRFVARNDSRKWIFSLYLWCWLKPYTELRPQNLFLVNFLQITALKM